ncbi:MAG: LPS export ABC transporter permease LptF [Deltaproteobacteria bacterium HGW-Deltaproteobacteria-18]|nr:MAG: LPS export ABC transporter permease LptF [Deltaproteobacteria bacterium HGW-Deltaproteobacteria-18]
MIRVPLLQRELFKEMGIIASICLGGFLCLILLGRLLQLRDLFMAQGVTFFDLVKLFTYLSPFFLIMLIPVSCMLGLFLTFLRMGADRELISLRAGGVSIWPLLPAPMLLCLLCSALTVWISLSGISWGMDNFRQTVVELARHKTSVNVQPGVFNTSFPGLTVYARQADPGSGALLDVFVLDSSRSKARATIVAPVGQIDSDPELGQVFVRLEDGHVYREEGGELSVISFESYILSLDMTRLLGGFELKDKAPKEMSWKDLQALKDAGFQDTSVNFQRRVEIELHKRFSLPAACIVLGFFALPLAFFFQGMKRQYGLIVCLGAFFLYYVLLSGGMSLAESGVLVPALALWLPNIVFMLAAAVGMWLVATEREVNFRAFRFWLLRILGMKGADA